MEMTAEAQQQLAQRRLRGRLTLVVLVLVFALPLVVASWIFYNPQVWTPSHYTNHGQLIDPPRPVESLSLLDDAGQPFDENRLRQHWTLMYVGRSECDLSCEAALFKTRQLRLALGRDIDRLERLYLRTDSQDADGLSGMREKHPRLTFVGGDESALAPLMNLLGSDAHDHVYLLDPLGNIVLRYGPEASSKGMLKDVKKLLRNSRIG